MMEQNGVKTKAKDEALELFSKYQSGFARRLKKPEALVMFTKEFNLDGEEAEIMFYAFDKDGNEVLSLWEFRQFYQTIGPSAHGIIKMFNDLVKDNSGVIDIEKAFDAMRTVESGKGKLNDEEIAYFLKTSAGETKEIDLHKFINMMCRCKVYKG